MVAAEPAQFLGLDLSTQQLKAIVISEDASVLHECAVHFDRDLPRYGTTNGAIAGPDGEVTSPVVMWLEALDLLMKRMKMAGVNFSAISAISGAGQQHGSVYWSSEAEEYLASMNPERGLAQQLCPSAFSLPDAPIWQDSSTTRECRQLEDFVSGPQTLADITGSRAYERFTGPQIMRIRRLKPVAYKMTSRISLVSSFLPSLFLGHIAPIEVSDASGMNLMDVLTCKWDDELMEACGGPELRSKLGPEPVPGGTTLGTVSDWWIKRWGFHPKCIVAPFTGDNSATVAALSAPGDAILSLGTSSTLLLSIPPAESPPKRFTTSHLLSHPTTLDAQIAMLCYKNGALAREQVRDRYADGDWEQFNKLLESSSPGNGGYAGFYFPLPEIIPPNVHGDFFFRAPLKTTKLSQQVTPVTSIPRSAHPRAILESQFLSILSRIEAILPPDSPPLQRLVITGGSSANPAFRQLAADVFGMQVYVSEGGKEAAGTGGALLAKFAWWKAENGGQGTFEEMTLGEVGRLRCVAWPREQRVEEYRALIPTYLACEAKVVQICRESQR